MILCFIPPRRRGPASLSSCAIALLVCLLTLTQAGGLRGQDLSPDLLPMFGQPALKRPEQLKKADEAFVRNASAKHGNRNNASNISASLGWASIRNRKSAEALRYFNESWLLNPKNPGAFWGFGAVMSERGNFSLAIEYLETAREFMDEEGQLVQLLADIGTVRSAYAVGMPPDRQLDRAQQFSAANQRFAESLELNPEYAPSWRQWAISLFDQQRYSEAAIKAGRAQELKAEPFPADFLRTLNSKLSALK